MLDFETMATVPDASLGFLAFVYPFPWPRRSSYEHVQLSCCFEFHGILYQLYSDRLYYVFECSATITMCSFALPKQALDIEEARNVLHKLTLQHWLQAPQGMEISPQ